MRNKTKISYHSYGKFAKKVNIKEYLFFQKAVTMFVAAKMKTVEVTSYVTSKLTVHR
jgi:hypothetical protein